MNVYILLTRDRVRVFTSERRALKVHQRAERMGVKVEFISTEAKRGDPYPRAKFQTREQRWQAYLEEADRQCGFGAGRTCDSTYARAEAGFADSGRD